MPTLPLKERVTEHNPLFRLVTAGVPERTGRSLVPNRPLAEGEQYRFHFDMTKCIGCHCCEVACNEQNNLPADQHWRRVGEIEGGEYPFAERLHLSMGCNHCLEPSCLTGCPVDAYRKDPINGLVLHNADACIGCQYCIWNCPYGVPQFNPERGVVGKCDMCHGRLVESQLPACVNACPEEAIRIETVNVLAWREEFFLAANAPGMPDAGQTISTTRITLPETLPLNMEKADHSRVRPEHPHWPLVFLTVLTQLSVGAFVGLWALEMTGQVANLGSAALIALLTGHLSLGVSVLHLGRPIYAYRALKMWRRSWLSREVLLFSLFAGASAAYAPVIWLRLPGEGALGLATTLAGLGGIFASASIYMVPARPAWNSRHTLADFFLTAGLLGPALLLALGLPDGGLRNVAIGAGVAQLCNQMLKFLRLAGSDEFELKASSRLLADDLSKLFLARLGLLLGAVLGIAMGHPIPAVGLAFGGEVLGRYLFFVSVAPRNMAASFLGVKDAA